MVEDLKSSTRDFIGKDDYKVGDISKEVDARVKDEVAKFRNKDEYELGDFLLAMDELSKKYTEELTGKPYEPGDLSTHLDTNIKARVAEFCGKDEYSPGDLTREMASRIETRVVEFTGKDYEVCAAEESVLVCRCMLFVVVDRSDFDSEKPLYLTLSLSYHVLLLLLCDFSVFF